MDRLVDDGVDVLHRLPHTLAQIAGLVSIPQFQSLELTGGGPAGSGPPPHGSIQQGHFCLHSGVAPGI